jgi:TolB-like protein
VTPDLSFLSGGIAELLTNALAERDTVSVVSVDRMEAWWLATFPGRTSVMPDSAVRLARALGVRRVVHGSVVGNGERLVVRASVVNTADLQTVASASLDAPLDSLSPLVDRLATLLIADAAGAAEEVRRIPRLSPQGLRAYLAGRSAYTRGELTEAKAQFTQALVHDSTLAAAAIGVALAADWLDDERSRTSALDLARSRTSQLSNAAQQQLTAMLGPRFPAALTGAEFVAGWERIAINSSSRPEPWIEFGRRLIADGRLAGVPNFLERARAAFHRALALDSASVPVRRALLSLALQQRNRDEVALAPSAADTSDALLPFSWRVAALQGDASLLATARERIPRGKRRGAPAHCARGSLRRRAAR